MGAISTLPQNCVEGPRLRYTWPVDSEPGARLPGCPVQAKAATSLTNGFDFEPVNLAFWGLHLNRALGRIGQACISPGNIR